MGFAQSLDSIVWSVVGTDAVVGAGVGSGSGVGACASCRVLLGAVESFMARRVISPFLAFFTASCTCWFLYHNVC